VAVDVVRFLKGEDDIWPVSCVRYSVSPWGFLSPHPALTLALVKRSRLVSHGAGGGIWSLRFWRLAWRSSVISASKAGRDDRLAALLYAPLPMLLWLPRALSLRG